MSIIGPSSLPYDLYDLVQLSPNDVGCIVKMEKDVFTLLDPYNNITRVKPLQIRNKRDSGRAVTSDVNGRPITAKDSVMIIDDSIVRKQATVLHVYRSFVYIQSRDSAENGGVSCVRNTSVAAIVGKGIFF